jgi:membrane protein
MQPTLDWIKRVITQPRGELTLWQRRARFAYDLATYGTRQLYQTRAPLMAAALSFRTLFALLPVLVVSTVIVKGVQGIDPFLKLVNDIIEGLGLNQLQIEPTSIDVTLTTPDARPPTLGRWLEGVIRSLGEINLSALGWIGFIIMVYSAITTVVTIENSFNAICRAPEGRSWMRRIPVYWMVLTIGPAVIGAMFWIDSQVDAWLAHVTFGHWFIAAFGYVWSFCTIWLVVFGAYMLIPNTAVAWRPALGGAFAAAILIQALKASLGAYFTNALSFKQLYGALGLIPVFMFWVYLMWLAVLYGLEIGAILQRLGGRRIEEMEESRHRTGLVDPAAVVWVMEVIGSRFAAGRPAAARHIAEATGLAESTIDPIIARLVSAGILHRLSREDHAVTLALPPEQIAGDRLIQIGFEMVDAGTGGSASGAGLPAGRRSPLVERLREAQRALARQVTVASLCRAEPTIAAGNQAESAR